jgi:hypothetical protein
VDEAVAHWRESLEIRPDGMNAQANLAWVLATSPDASLRDGAKAVELAKKVIARAGYAPNDVNTAIVLRTLAAGLCRNRPIIRSWQGACSVSMRFEESNVQVKYIVPVFIVIAGLGFHQAKADMVAFKLGVGNPAISGYPGPYASVSVDRTSSNTATITFTSLT